MTVRGAAGTTTSGASLLLVTLDTGHYVTTDAAADGSFTASLFAPAGTSIMVKADVFGGTLQTFKNDPVADELLTGLAGTILGVPVPVASGTGVAFAGAGLLRSEQPRLPPAWTLGGTLDATSVAPGGSLRVQGTLSVLAATLDQTGAVDVRLSLERLSNTDGSGNFGQNLYASTILTPTGLPLERPATYTGTALTATADVSMTQSGSNIEGSVDLTLTLPADLPAGYYRPFLTLDFHLTATTTEQADILLVDRADRRPMNFTEFGPKSLYLPIAKVGSPAAPQIPWALLVDTSSNATRGTRAVADRERFGIASRILTQSETFIIPRVDAETGQTITYRLEPFALSVSVGDRGTPPAIPLIPFSFPSGGLAVTIARPKPDVRSFPVRAVANAWVGGLEPDVRSFPVRAVANAWVGGLDLWAYSYRSIQRPLVRVREQIAEDRVSGQYWRFNDQYGSQLGVGREGDLPNDIKFQYGGVVVRGSALSAPQYAAYGSLFVLIPEAGDAKGGSRTFPPFQGNGGGPDGGPIMTLKGENIDLFIHLTGVRPGTILEVGDTFSISGAVGPTLAATVSTTVTMPSGQVVQTSGQASRIGYYHQPGDDFTVAEAGVYTVDVTVTYEGTTSAGGVTTPFPSGNVLGTTNGRFSVYVVPAGSDLLSLNVSDGFVSAPIRLSMTATSDLTLNSAHVTAMMPGFVLEGKALAASGNSFGYAFDASTFMSDFPNLDADGSDVVTVALFASGTDAQGRPSHRARHVVLHGRQLLSLDTIAPTPFSISNLGGTSLVTSGGAGSPTIAYGRIQPVSTNSTPAGLAIFGLTEGGVLVTEAAVPVSPLIQTGRIYAEVNGPVNTGVAIANPNASDATISFSFTDADGVDFGQGQVTIPGHGQIAAFLNESPFNGGSTIQGTFFFSASSPVSVVALRGFSNERSEFLITTLPVSPLSSAVTGTSVVFPHFADGGGWTTQVILVNPSNAVISGSVGFRGQGSSGNTASPVEVTIDGTTASSFAYTIPPRSSRRLGTAGASSGVRVGSVRVTPGTNQITPTGLGVFSFQSGGFTVAQAGVPALAAGSAFRVYAEASGDFAASAVGSIQTGIAIANTASSEVPVTFELTSLSGASTGLTGSVTVPNNGQVAMFLNQIDGLEALGLPFQGVLRISSPTPINVVGLRGRYNERGDFLITTTSPVDEATPTSTSEMVFPHLVDSGGYTTQIILFSGAAGQTAVGNIRFFNQAGTRLNLSLN